MSTNWLRHCGDRIRNRLDGEMLGRAGANEAARLLGRGVSRRGRLPTWEGRAPSHRSLGGCIYRGRSELLNERVIERGEDRARPCKKPYGRCRRRLRRGLSPEEGVAAAPLSSRPF